MTCSGCDGAGCQSHVASAPDEGPVCAWCRGTGRERCVCGQRDAIGVGPVSGERLCGECMDEESKEAA